MQPVRASPLSSSRRSSIGADTLSGRVSRAWEKIVGPCRCHSSPEHDRATDGGPLFAVDAKARFRTFLLACCRHYLSHQCEYDRTKKRGGDRLTLSIDMRDAENRYRDEPVDGLTPETLYDRRSAASDAARMSNGGQKNR